MRIIAGKFKRRTLVTPKGTHITRPTADRVKESIFNILMPYLPRAHVLDLFAGSGALGLEAMSRGAQCCTFIENNSEALICLKQNIDKIQISEHVKVVKTSVAEFLVAKNKHLNCHNAEFSHLFEVIFADPPYASSWYDGCMESLAASGLCSNNCLLVLEMANNFVFVSEVIGWKKIDTRSFGSTRVEFWKREGDKNLEKSPAGNNS